MNSLDQFSPFGSTTFQRREDGTPISQTVTLSPQMENWLNSQFGASTKLQDATSRQLDYLPTDQFKLPTGTSADDYATQAFGSAVIDPSNFDTSKIAQTSYDQARSLIQPDIDSARKAAEIQLAQRGVNPGDEAYNAEMDRIDRQANTALAGAARQATLDAGNEQTRAVNNALTARNFGNNQYQQNLSNVMLERNQPFADAAALMGTTPSFQTPSFMNTTAQNVSAPDYMGAVNSNYQAQVQQANNSNNAMGGILGSIAGPLAKGAAGMIFSDEDMKEGIEEQDEGDDETVLMLISGMPVSEWQYKPEAQEGLGLDDDRHVGPMAQDMAERFGGDGSTIDITSAIGRLMQAVRGLERRTSGMRHEAM